MSDHTTRPRATSRHRRIWLVVGLVAVLVAGGSVAAGRLAWTNRCETAVPEAADHRPASQLVAPMRLGDHWPPDWLAAAIGAPEPFGALRFAITEPKIDTAPELVLGGTLLVREGPGIIRAVDADTGQTRWQREPRGGGGQPVVPVGADLVLVADPFDEELTVLAVDPVDGAVRGCVQLDSTAPAPHRVVAPAGDGVLAVAHGGGRAEPALSLVDLRAGTVTAEAPIGVQPRDLRRAGDVVVASTVPADRDDDWRSLVVDHSDRVRADELPLRAYYGSDASPSWEYAFDLGEGGIPFAHSLVDAGDDVILLVASRFDPDEDFTYSRMSGDGVESHLVALNPVTGRQRWSRALPAGDLWGPPEVRRFGDTVMVKQAEGPDEPERVVGYDLATGEQRWRLDESVKRLRDGAHLAADRMALLPASGGLVAVDLVDGGTRTYFEVNTFEAVADDDTIGVVLSFEPMLLLYDRR